MREMLLAYPGDDLVTDATVTADDEDADYPIENVQDLNPQNPYKATDGGAVITITHAGSETPVGLGIINHNLVGATVTLAGGTYSEAVTIPARSTGGQCTSAWKDLRTAVGIAASAHTITITGASAAIAIGRICLVTALQTVRYSIGEQGQVDYFSEFPVSSEPTYLWVDMTYDKGVRLRKVAGQVRRLTDQQIAETLNENAKGQNIPFLVVPDAAVNDCWYAKLDQQAMKWAMSSRRVHTTPIAFRELSMGLPL